MRQTAKAAAYTALCRVGRHWKLGPTQLGLRILAYHGLWTTPGYQFGDRLFITPEQFEKRMRLLKTRGDTVLGLDQAVTALAENRLPRNAVVVTIDDGWQSTYTHTLPILEKYSIPATVYITSYYVDHRAPVINVAIDYILQASPVAHLRWTSISGRVFDEPLNPRGTDATLGGRLYSAINEAEQIGSRVDMLVDLAERLRVPAAPWMDSGQFHLMTREEIRNAHARGLDIQLHTHRHRVLPGECAREIADNRAVLGEVCGSALEHFCYPSGNYDPNWAAQFRLLGVHSATTCRSGPNHAGGDPFQLNRFLDGRSVSAPEFEVYLNGTLDYVNARLGRAPR